MSKQLKRIIEKIMRRFSTIFTVGTIIQCTDKTAKVALRQEEVKEKVPVIQHYGFRSLPPAHTPCLVAGNGDRNNLAVIGSANHDAPKLEDGETAIYAQGSSFALKGKKAVLACSKFSVRNEHGELLALIEELCDALIQARVVTSNGPQPLTTVASIQAIKQKWGQFVDR